MVDEKEKLDKGSSVDTTLDHRVQTIETLLRNMKQQIIIGDSPTAPTKPFSGTRLIYGKFGLLLSIDDSGVIRNLGSIVGKTAAPAVTDDSGDGYYVGTIWVDETNNVSYVLVDHTVGAAVWVAVGSGEPRQFKVPLYDLNVHASNIVGWSTWQGANTTFTKAVVTGINAFTNAIAQTYKVLVDGSVISTISFTGDGSDKDFEEGTDIACNNKQVVTIQHTAGDNLNPRVEVTLVEA